MLNQTEKIKLNLKNNNEYIYEFELAIDHIQLEKEFSTLDLKIYNKETDSTDGFNSVWFGEEMSIRARKTSNYIINELSILPETHRIKLILDKIFSTSVVPIFTMQRKNFDLPVHIDPPNLQAAVNIILPGSLSKVYFLDGGEFEYKTAILNVQKPHGVKKTATDRRMIKYCIRDISYDTCVERLKLWQNTYS